MSRIYIVVTLIHYHSCRRVCVFRPRFPLTPSNAPVLYGAQRGPRETQMRAQIVRSVARALVRSLPFFDIRAAVNGIHLSGECVARVRDRFPTECIPRSPATYLLLCLPL